MADHDTNSKAKPGGKEQAQGNEFFTSKESNNPTPSSVGHTTTLKKRNNGENSNKDKMCRKARTTYSKNVVVKLSKTQLSEPSTSDANDVESSEKSSRDKPLCNDGQDMDATSDRPDETTKSQSDSNHHESQNDNNNILSEKEAKRAERLKRHRHRRRPVAAAGGAKSKDIGKTAEGVAASSTTAAENGGILSEKESRREKRLQRHREQRQNDTGAAHKKRSRQRTKNGDVSTPLPREGPALQGNEADNTMADEDMVPGAFSVYPEGLDPEAPLEDEEEDLDNEAFEGEAVAVAGVSPRRRERRAQDQFSNTNEMDDVDKPKSVFQNKTYRILLVGLVLVIVAAVVVLSIFLTREDDSGSEQESQTTSGQSQTGTTPTFSPTASPAPSFATVPVSVVIGFDSITYETSWQLQCDGEIVNEVRAGSYAGYAAFDVIVDTTFVREGAECTFTIFDTGSDGLCCKSGEGFYQVFLADQDEVPSKGLVGEGAEFATSQSLQFVAVAI